MKTESTVLIKEAMIKRFLTYKELGEKAVLRLDDAQLHWRHHKGDNNIYIIVKHLHGNMLSRFTEFLHSDGEKSWRKRDNEFEEDNAGRENILRLWNEGWECVLNAVNPLSDDDMQKTVTIRGEKHSVLDALLRQVAHYAYHVGQIVYIAKTIKEEGWESLSIPRNKSQEFNEAMKQNK